MTISDEQKPRAPFCSFCEAFDVEELKKKISRHLLSSLGRDPERARSRDICRAVSLVLRDILVERWIRTQKSYYARKRKRVYYLSMEFLVGRSLGNALINMGLVDKMEHALVELGFELDEIREEEEDAALGNGGLGRLAACFMDSIATMGVPAYGYGIRYEYGLFFQRIVDGFQVESPDNWLRYGTPWEFERTQYLFPVRFYGRVNSYLDDQGRYRADWVDTESVMAMACDLLVPGFNNDQVVNMRLWTARATREFDLSYFNRGNYIAAMESKVNSETISKLLYPSDHFQEGRELRLKQQYFFVSATFQDIFRRYKNKNTSFERFSDEIAVQLNDTHPAIAIPELMRLLVDGEGLAWEKAWDICVRTFAYTVHTLMPEALETWPVELLARVLPRHMEIILEINRRFLDQVAVRFPGENHRLRNMSLIEEGPEQRVRMAHLAIAGSHSVNGVAALHTHLMRTRIFKDFEEFFPGRFNNKTNGITPRRWLLKANPGLADLITATIGGEWVTDLDHLRHLAALAEDRVFQRKWSRIKQENKKRLAKLIATTCRITVDPDSFFDVQVKRIHEYKRQLLNVLHVISLYQSIIREPDRPVVPRTVIFAGKAAPSYAKAKLIIRLINGVAAAVNNDPRVGERLRVVFIPNYGVSLAEKIIPAADLSEQISTVGTEASGTGNMKFALNGALTIGTLDGANIEIREEVGPENIFIFGMTAENVEWERRNPSRAPREIYEADPVLRAAINAIGNGAFSNGDHGLYQPLLDSLFDPHDPYLLLQDFEDYLRCQQEVARAYQDQPRWLKMSILNVAHMGIFSSDRTIREYAREIWGVPVEPDQARGFSTAKDANGA
ncbi:MAG: glycogen/starch/alpha-glucan phosphorylase [Desulfobacterales bacterium]|nr:glycogen/starch/alpha-glucan phosphorylase [Desulfobacterales bacterium]